VWTCPASRTGEVDNHSFLGGPNHHHPNGICFAGIYLDVWNLLWNSNEISRMGVEYFVQFVTSTEATMT